MSHVFSFINRANDCWGNSLLQLLYGVPEFRQVLADAKRKNDPFLSAIYDTYEDAIACSKYTLEPEKSAGQSGRACNILRPDANGLQQDPIESFTRVLMPYICNYERAFLPLFVYPIMQNLYCARCGQITNVQLNLRHERNVSFPAIVLTQHMPSLNLKYDVTSCAVKRRCAHCNENTDHNEVYEHANIFPAYIMYQYMTVNDDYTLNTANKSIPRILRHESFDKIMYELVGCVIHLGDTPASGHYIAFGKRVPQGAYKTKWYEFNDTIAREDEPPLCSTSVQMALYARVDN